MRSYVQQADDAGELREVGARGIGFQLVPAIAPGAAATVRAGSFPVRVRLRCGGKQLGDEFPVVNSSCQWVAREGEEFTSFDVLGAEAGDSWLVVTLENKGDGVISAGAKTRYTAQVQEATELPTAAPADGDGYRIRPGTLSHDLYFSGTLGDVTVWQRSRGGTWYESTQVIDGNDGESHLEVKVAADRIYFQAAGAGQLLELDVTEEVG